MMSWRRIIPSMLMLPLTSLYQKLSPGIRIFMYHRVRPFQEYDQLTVSPERFAEQVKWLSENCHLLRLSEAIEMLRLGTKIPKHAVVVTFDDGYKDNLQFALPILERYNVPACIFLTSDFVKQQKQHTRYPSEKNLHLNLADIKSLKHHPLLEWGSHSISHPSLQQVSEAQMQKEVHESLKLLGQDIDQESWVFCYPSGDYGPRELEALKKSAYCAAVTVSPGVNRASTHRFALKRTEINQKDTPMSLLLKMYGAFDPWHLLLDLRRRKNFAKLAQDKKPHENSVSTH